MAEINKVGAGEVVWLVVLWATRVPIEGGAHTSQERAQGTIDQLEADYPKERGKWTLMPVEIEW